MNGLLGRDKLLVDIELRLCNNTTMKLKHNRKVLNNLLPQNLILYTILIFSLSYGVVELLREKVVSPCPEEGCYVPVKTVYAKDADLSINQEIYKVFGPYGDRAMKLLTGKGCQENPSLNPKAINVNKDLVGSKDFGVFQINNYWQGVTNTKFLLDPHINIRLAYKIFVDSGYSFKMWTCGKYHNI